MPYLTIQGLKVRYVDRHPVPGGSAPVVFIHGAGGSHQHWLLQVRAFRQSPSYALDLPGHGRSEGPGRDSIQAYGDWLVSFLDKARLDRAVLAGHSMGGGIRQMEAVPGNVFRADFAACDRFDVMARLGDITAPVVAVCGTKDVMTPPKYSAYLRDHISGAELCLIEGAGHMVMLEEPAEVVKALAALVEKL